MITVEILDNQGIPLNTRQFSPGQMIEVSGKVTGSFGLAAWNNPVRVDIYDSFAPVHAEDRANVLGDFSVFVTMPDSQSKALLVVSSDFPVGGTEQLKIPIAIGSPDVILPDKPSEPDKPILPGILDPLKSVGSLVPIFAIVAAIVLIANLKK